MSNPLFNLLGGNKPQMNGQLGQISNIINAFQQFKSTFSGDPRSRVQELLNSGKMSQEQYNQLTAVARQIAPMLGAKK